MLPKAKTEHGLIKLKVAQGSQYRRNWREVYALVTPPSRRRFYVGQRRRPEASATKTPHGILSARFHATPPHTDHLAAQMANDRSAGVSSCLARGCRTRRHTASHAKARD